jgi:hypothetical protein
MAKRTDYEPTPAEAEVLDAVTEDALERAGAAGGSAGGALGGAIGGLLGGGLAGGGGGAVAGAAGGRRGGARGGRFGARFTKPRTAKATVSVPSHPNVTRERVAAAIEESGELIDDPNGRDDGSLWGIVPSGTMDMMPALVRVEIETARPAGSRVSVRATGEEGLIKQRVGAKAADRIAAAASQGA